MKKTFKKMISVLLVVVMLVCSAPLQSFIGVAWSSWFSVDAQAASVSDGETYWAMNHDEALGFIAFIYDTGKVTEDMMNAGDLYTLLTGGFERGSIEELCAKISFLATAKGNISSCINNYSAVMNTAYDSLLEYLQEQAGGDIDDGLANSTLDSVKDSLKSIILTLGDASENVLENIEHFSDAYGQFSSIKDKVETMKACINGINYVFSSANKAPYEYIRTYISNFAISDSLSDIDGVAEIIEGYNSVIKMDEGGKLSGAFLFYGNDKKVEQVESYGRYIYYITKSLENSGVYVDSNGAIKIVQVHCPTDVYIYDSLTGSQLLTIIDDKITIYDNCVLATVCNSQKLIVLPEGQEYVVDIVATDNGTMDYSVTEYIGSSYLREVNYSNVELIKDEKFSSSIPEQIQISASEYNLVKENGDEIQFTEDTLPPIKDSITDVIVAEELFDGFPTDLIDLVGNAMFNMESVVDLSGYDISTEDAVALFSAVAKYYPVEYSLVTSGDFTYKIIVSPNLDRIMNIRFYYGDDANLSTYQKRVKDLNAEIDALVAKTKGMDEFEKALYIHDYIVLNCEYDLELLEILETDGTLSGELRAEKYTEYSVLVNGTGICGSYALAYRAILNAAGMECLYLSSAQMNHAWNLVKIDGDWYHVDCCWDDPVPDTYGRARRTYFLCTDAEIMELNHYSWTPGKYKAVSSKYSEMPRNYDIKQKYDNASDSWYYLEGSSLYSADEYGKNIEELGSIAASSLDFDNDTLYYAKGRYVYTYNTETAETEYVYFLSNADSGDDLNKAYISNIYVDGENLSYYKSVYDEDDGKSKTLYDEDLLQKEKFDSITGISLNASEYTMDVFEERTLTATIQGGSSVEGIEVVWSSSNASIASVDKNGRIKGMNAGEATITATILDYTASCVITVNGDGLSGMCGDNTTWNFDITSSTLTISGNGSMVDYFCMNYLPWEIQDNIVSIKILNGVTNIGMSAFEMCRQLNTVSIGNTVTEIGSSAFRYCSELENIIIPNCVEKIGSMAFGHCQNLTSITISKNVNTIEFGAFEYCEKLSAITIPNGITSISGHLFAGCSNLTDIEIPDTVTIIDDSAFSGCSNLTKISLPDKITSIGESAFYDCIKLASIEIPEGVTSIGRWAFYNCTNIVNMKIPSSVTDIGSYAISHCANLENITVDIANPNYSSDEFGVLFDKNKSTLIQYPTGSSRVSYTIPDGVTIIDIYSFYGSSNLRNIIIPNSISKINAYAFQSCNKLTDITIPANTDIVNITAFRGCKNLTKITVDANNLKYKSDEFGVLYNKDMTRLFCYPAANDLSTYIIPKSVVEINDYAFYYSKNLKNIVVSDNVRSIGEYAFAYCSNLTNFVLPKSTTIIAAYTFSYCTNMKSITLHNNLSAIEENAFYYCNNLTSVTIPNSVTSIGEYAFAYCEKLKQIKIPQSITMIDDLLFYSCKSLSHITLPKSITKIGERAFNYCESLEHIGYLGTAKDFDNISIYTSFNSNKNFTNAKHFHFNFCDTTDVVMTEKILSTCTEDGYTQASYCTVCECYLDGETIPAAGHSYSVTETVPGTCTTAPYEVHTCSTCGDNYTKTGKIEYGHSYEKSVVAPTCDEKGYTKEVCTKCDETLISDFTSPLGHEFIINRSADYCSAHGTIEYACKNCDYKEYVTSDASDLVTETVIVESTCTKSGSKSEVCVLCKATMSTEIISPVSHDYSEEWTVDKEATCTENGSKSKHCTRCDAKRLITIIEATGHTDTKLINATASTCTAEGYTGDTYCNLCKSVIDNGEAIEKLDHSYKAVVTAPTCTEKGYTTHTCSACGDNYKDSEKATLGHNVGNFVVTIASTCLKDGLETATCSRCSYSETRTISATGHTDNDDDGYCDSCDTELESSSSGCSHMCHSDNAFISFFWKIINFLYRIFGINQTCDCGVAHW